MSDKFHNLRETTQSCIEQLGASRNEELFEFRNAATFTVVHQLLREHDRMRDRLAQPVATATLGELTAAEAALLQTYRSADERAKGFIEIAASAAGKKPDEQDTPERCEVIGIESARTPRA